MKFSFAEVDESENFTFNFTSNITIYPGKNINIVALTFQSKYTILLTLLLAGTPPDGSPVMRIRTFKIWLIALFDTLAILGIIFAVACFLFNLIFRNRR